MKLPESKIEKAVAVKDVRYYLNDVWLDVENRRAIATNGHICAVVPVEIDPEDTSGPVSIESITQARKLKSQHIQTNGALVLDNGASFPRPEKANYPDIDKVIPNKSEYAVSVGIDAALLLKLAEAINPQRGPYRTNVLLHISSSTEGIKVTGRDPGPVGVIMPLRM